MNAATEPAGGSRQNPEDVERDSDAIRADMDRTLEALERKFSPRQLVDRSVVYLREHGAELLQQAGDTIKRNPVPALLTAAGVVWLTATIAQARRTRDSYGSPSPEEDDNARRGDASSDTDEGGGSSDTDEGGGSSLRSRGARARAAVSNVTERASGRVHSTIRSARTRAAQARNDLGNFVQEQPIVAGMLALTAGALLGTAMPVSEYEKRMRARSTDTTRPQSEQDNGPEETGSVDASGGTPSYS